MFTAAFATAASAAVGEPVGEPSHRRAVRPDPITVTDSALLELLATHGRDKPGPQRPGDLVGVLCDELGRRRGTRSRELVALLRLVLVADTNNMIMHCTTQPIAADSAATRPEVATAP